MKLNKKILNKYYNNNNMILIIMILYKIINLVTLKNGMKNKEILLFRVKDQIKLYYYLKRLNNLI